MVEEPQSEQEHEHIPARHVAVLVGAMLLVFGFAWAQRFVVQSPQFAAVISSVLVDLTNQDRTQARIGTLRTNQVLVAAAQAKANDMAMNGYFAHVAPDGKDSWYWFQQEGYAFLYAGENLAMDFNDSTAVENAWMNSPTHRANVLNDRFTEIGIATAQGTYQGRTTTFVVQMFGTPLPEPLPVTAPAVVRTISPAAAPEETALATTVPVVEPAIVESEPQVLGVEQDVVSEPVASVAVVSAALPQASLWEHLLSSPKTTLRYAYYLLGLLMLLMLIARTGVEIRRQHRDHVVIVLALLFLMLILFFVADTVLFSEPVLALTFF